jgi:hypothetical protein
MGTGYPSRARRTWGAGLLVAAVVAGAVLTGAAETRPEQPPPGEAITARPDQVTCPRCLALMGRPPPPDGSRTP